MPKQAIMLLSGGIDSAACTRFLQDQGYTIDCVSIDYGQAAAKPERIAARSFADLLHVTLNCVDVVSSRRFGPGEILGRNAFLVLTALMTSKITLGVVALGIHAGTRYYDCSTGFLACLDRLVAEYTDGCVRAVAPFITWSKARVFDYYVRSGLPEHIPYSCEAGTDPACGQCASCQDRRKLGCFH
jgi:7-cyano-7-deazaguanine synthase